MAVCVGCSKPLCDDCRVIYDGKNICEQCAEQLNYQLNKNSNNDIDEIIDEIAKKADSGKKQLEKLINDGNIEEEFKNFMNNADERISRLTNIFESRRGAKEDDNYGYLICDKCNGYYELKEGESLEDFESCECGGTLKFTKTLGSI